MNIDSLLETVVRLLQGPDGSITKVLEYFDFTIPRTSTYRRISRTLIIEGPIAKSHDLPRALEWGKKSGTDFLWHSTDNDASLFFDDENDAILAMMALS